MICSGRLFLQPSCRLCRHPPLHVMPRGYKEGKFAVCLELYFIAETDLGNLFKQSLSQLRWQLSLPKRALLFVLFEMLIYSQTILPKRADLRFIWLAILHRFTDFQSIFPSAAPTPSLAQGGQVLLSTRLVIYSGKQNWCIYLFNLSVSCTDSSLYQREPC